MGSPAISAGSAALCQTAPISNHDQRGDPRNATTRGACDTGAYDTGKILATLYVSASAHSNPACALASKTNPFATVASTTQPAPAAGT